MDIIKAKPLTAAAMSPSLAATLFQTAASKTATASSVIYNSHRYGSHRSPQFHVDAIVGNATTTTTTSGEWAVNVTESPMMIRSCTQTIVLTTILSVIILFTITGNFLVIASIIVNVHLRTTTNYFIANLAIADLLLGTTVLPFSATLEVLQYWVFGQIFCDIWAAIDVLCCTASILSLCVISIDRYIGVTRPLQHAAIVQHSRAVYVILGVWLLSIIISVAPLIGWKEKPDPNPRICTVTTHTGYVVFSATLSFYIPCLIILLVYFRIYRETVKYTKCIASGSKMAKVDEENSVALRIHTGRSSSSTTSTTTTTDLHNKSYSISPKAGHKNHNSYPHNQQNPSRVTNCSDCGNGTKSETPSSARGSNRSLIGPSPVFQSVNKNGRKRSSALTVGNRVTFSSRVAKFKREKKAAKTLGIVVGVFITCWLPFFLTLPIQSLCQRCEIPPLVFKLFFWLGYCNSTMNPIIYTCYSTEFRRAFQDILCCRKCRRRPAVSVHTKVKVKGTPQPRLVTSGKKKTIRSSYELKLSLNADDHRNNPAPSRRFGLRNSVTSSSFQNDDINVYGNAKRPSCYTSSDQNSSTTNSNVSFICIECHSVCQNNVNTNSPSNLIIKNKCKVNTRDRKNSMSPSTNVLFAEFGHVQCVCCKKDFYSKEKMVMWPDKDHGQDKVPSSCEISMASLSCHSSSPISSS